MGLRLPTLVLFSFNKIEQIQGILPEQRLAILIHQTFRWLISQVHNAIVFAGWV